MYSGARQHSPPPRQSVQQEADITITNPGPDSQHVTATGGYTYFAAPTVTAVSPSTQTLDGGSTLTITGTGFYNISQVEIGTTVCSPGTVNLVSSTTLTCTAPAKNAGTYVISVTTPSGKGTSSGNLITYVATPTITNINPATGYPAGNDTIIITGTNFNTGVTVEFGSTPAASVTRNNATQLTVVTPAHATGTVAVTVTNTDSQYATSSFSFTNLSVQKLGDDSVDYTLPSDGNGGYAANLVFSLGLTSGQKNAVEDMITAGADTTPSFNWTNGNKTLAISATEATTFNNDVIATLTLADLSKVDLLLIDSKLTTTQATATANTSVTSSTPETVIQTLSTPITVTVSGNTTNATLNVDSLTTNNAGILPAITVNSTTANGTWTVAIPDTTTVTASSTWNSIITLPTEKALDSVTVTPSEGMTATVRSVIAIGSDTVSLSFNKGVRLKFTGARNKLVGFYKNSTFTPITDICSADSQAVGNELTDKSESYEAGDCKINSGSDLIVWTKHFTDFVIYDEQGGVTVTNVNNSSGGLNGLEHVVITGTNFGTGAIASFGGEDASQTYVLSGTKILAITPSGSLGPADVTVRNLTGTPGTLTGGYTYDADTHFDYPTVDAVNPTTGSTAEATDVDITGTNFAQGASVYFGQNQAIPAIVTGDTSISATTASHAAGAVDVIVFNSNGTWGIGTDLFTYEATHGSGGTCNGSDTQQCATQEITCAVGSLSFGHTPEAVMFDPQTASGNTQQSYDSAVNDDQVLTYANVLSVDDSRSGSSTNCPLSSKGFTVQATATPLYNSNGTSTPISNANMRIITSNELNPLIICDRADGLDACYSADEGTGNLRDIVAPVLYDDFARSLANQYAKFNQPNPYLYKAEDPNTVTNVSATYPQGDAASPVSLNNALNGTIDLLTTHTSHNQTIYTGVVVKTQIPAGQDPGTYTGTITYTLSAQN